jgi:hypothetical protein
MDDKVGVTRCVKQCGDGFREKNSSPNVRMYRESNYADMSNIQDIAITVPVRSCEKCDI